MSEGIDIYVANQTVTDWGKVRANDIDWCYQKVSDGLTTRTINPGPFKGVAQGGYHFSQPGSPVDQANLLIKQVEKYGLVDLNPALDLEDNPPTSGKANIPNSQKASFAIAFGRQVLSKGHGFTLYANDSDWQLIYNQVMNALPHTFRWVARYRTLPPVTPYDAWQYTSSGSCPGISTGSLDRNRGKKPLNLRNSEIVTPEDVTAIKVAVVNELMERQVGLGAKGDIFRAFSEAVRLADVNSSNAANGVATLNTKLDVLTQLIEKSTNDPDITATNVKAWVEDAVARNLNITGTIEIKGDSTES